jgi:hypothetical protein
VTRAADRLRADAGRLVERELHRRGSALDGLGPESRAAVEALAVRVMLDVADGVLEHAHRDRAVAAALASIYGADSDARGGVLVESALGAAD